MQTASTFLTARWRWLAMLNYAVDPAILAPWVPEGTTLDGFNGKTFVSLVGFRFLDTRVLGIPIPFHRHFDEVNLRFYVRREHVDGPRRGVVFIKEIVPRAAIAWVARTVYNENYVALPMSHENEIGLAPEPWIAYRWRTRDRWNRLAVRIQGDPRQPAPESEESFITEHYWGYARQRKGATVEYQVEHPPWRVWTATAAELDCDIVGLYGSQYSPFLQGKQPCSAFLAEGSAVTVRRGRPLG